MNRPLRLIAFSLFLALSGCATDKYSFVRYGQKPEEKSREYSPTGDPQLSDRLALNYAASVASILRSKYQGARITREASNTAQIVLAGLGGAGAGAFGYSTSTLAVLGLGSAGVPELQRIFGAKERAQIYQDAVRLIEEAEVDYLAHNQKPTDQELTQNGVTLFQRVTASLHVVEKTLAGNLPTIQDMEKATERMTQAGAVASEAGEPVFNLFPANGDPPMAKSDLDKFSGRRHRDITVSKPGEAPKSNTPSIIVLTGPLRDRSIALQNAFETLSIESARSILGKQHLVVPAGAEPKDVVALRILALAKYDPLPKPANAIAILSAYRKSLATEDDIGVLEGIYRGLEIPLTVTETNLPKRNLALGAC